MNGKQNRLRDMLQVIPVVLVSLVAFTVTFYITTAIYDSTGIHPPALVAQIITSLLGVVLIGVGFTTAIKIAQLRGWIPENRAFNPLIEVMHKIASGDFNVRLDSNYENNPGLGMLAASINRMASQLGEMEQMRQEFISNVSHEIQSPLTSIRGYTEALQDEHLSPEQRAAYLNIIAGESMRLSRISDNLLRLATLESDQVKFSLQLFRLDKQIRDLVLACEPQWSSKALDLEVCLDKVSITADPDLLSQVWMNLIGNSIKFTPPGGRIWIELKQEQDNARFYIRDTGIGISEEERIHLFERFYKADRSRTQSGGGSGLGLSIAKKIVELHHGSIQADGAPESGAIFTVCLPLQPHASAEHE